ncbi:hypothetical protein PAXRUDRAFT_76057, partial [Paxillus rubicundulus Ve08.2h10]
DHPSHEEHYVKRDNYMEVIKRVKQEHCIEWLDNINSKEIWIANHYLNAEPSDRGSSKIPTL